MRRRPRHRRSHHPVRPQRARRRALTGGELVRLEGSGHAPQARDPVVVNLIIRELRGARRAGGRRRRARGRGALARPKRALFVSSPIGLGHAWRDVAIADELRRQVPGLEIALARAGAGDDGAARARRDDPSRRAPSWPARRRTSTARPASTTCTRFKAMRRMDEILCANFMVFDDVVREEQFDLWIGDEAWELDHFLHENPELKTAPYAWLTDFVGFLPMPAGGEREAFLTADYNAEMIEHVERFPSVRDRAIFVGDPDDIVPATFGPGPAGDPRVDRAALQLRRLRPRLRPADARRPRRAARGARLRRRAALHRLGRRLRGRRAAAAARDRGAAARARAHARPAHDRRRRAADRPGDACRRSTGSRCAATCTSCTATSPPATSRSCRAG